MWRVVLLLVVPAIAADAPPGSPAAAALAADADAAAGPDTRHLWLPGTPAERAELLQALTLHCHLTSREAAVAPPRQVAADVVAVSLADYGWDRLQYGRAKQFDPYFHVKKRLPDGTEVFDHAPWLPQEAVRRLADRVDSRSPLLRGDWLLVQGARQLSLDNKQTGLGYYDVLQLKSRDDYFRLIGLEKRSFEVARGRLRGAVEPDVSGVSQYGRQVGRLPVLGGYAWFTLDSDAATGRQNPIQQLRPGDYRHKAEEWYAPLPNGLPATYLCTDKGEQQDTAPDFIGADDSPLRRGRDLRIHANLACHRCHAEDGLRPVPEWVRRNVRAAAGGPGLGLGALDPKEAVRLRADYFGDLDGALSADRKGYAAAFLAATAVPPGPVVPKGLPGLKYGEAVKLYARAFHRYATEPVTVERAAAETGYAPAEFLARLRAFGAGKARAADPRLDPATSPLLRDPPGTVARVHFEEFFPVLMSALLGLDLPRDEGAK